MNFVNENRLSLIQKITDRIDDMGFEPTKPVIQKPIEKPKPVRKPLDLAPLIEHTLLKPEATRRAIIRLCEEAKRFHFRGVCVNPVFVNEAQKQLAVTDCSVITVVGFPLGANVTDTKVEETKLVIELGANEVDMVISLGALKDGDYKTVCEEIRAVVEAAGQVP